MLFIYRNPPETTLIFALLIQLIPIFLIFIIMPLWINATIDFEEEKKEKTLSMVQHTSSQLSITQ